MARYRESKRKMAKYGGNRMQSRGKRSMKDYDMSESYVAQTYTSDWSEGQEGAMKQYDNGSMNYYDRKGRLDKEDIKRLGREMLDQSNSQY